MVVYPLPELYSRTKQHSPFRAKRLIHFLPSAGRGFGRLAKRRAGLDGCVAAVVAKGVFVLVEDAATESAFALDCACFCPLSGAVTSRCCTQTKTMRR